MIYVNKQEILEKEFESLLEKSKFTLESSVRTDDSLREMDGVAFESMVYEHMIKAASGGEFDGFIEQTGAHAFPDIVARKLYGVEVKKTTANRWTSTGNSVLETTRIDDVNMIYMFFGKFGDRFEVKYRKYQECLCEIGVTHSPRYKIDMNLSKGESIFEKMGITYDEFRLESDPIKRLKDYYRSKLEDGEDLWWMDSSAEESSVSPVIKPFRLFDVQTKTRFIDEVFALFPEIFEVSTLKFERVAAYLITHYNAVSSNIRDVFSASGRVNIKVDGIDVETSQILGKLFIRASQIEKAIESFSPKTLAYYWNVEVTDDPVQTWKNLLEKHSKNSKESLKAADVFEAGLKSGK